MFASIGCMGIKCMYELDVLVYKVCIKCMHACV